MIRLDETRRARVEDALGRHYAAQRTRPDRETIDALTRAMLAQDARSRALRAHDLGLIGFIAAQARFIPSWTWLVQAGAVVFMTLVAQGSTSEVSAKLAVGVLSALSVLVGVPTLHASKLHGVAELEYACPYNAASVIVARMIALGCSSALMVALMVAATAASINMDAFVLALWAAPPFFMSCAGSLVLLRRMRPTHASVACVGWAAACSATLVVIATRVPALYDRTATAVWALAALVALAWLSREVAQTVRSCAAGIDSFTPGLARG